MLDKLDRHRLTILHAESGSGKTSLLQAGLAARLLAQGHLPLCLRPYQQHPGRSIRAAFLSDYDKLPELERFCDERMSLRGFLERVSHYLGDRQLFIFLDQFEEFFEELQPTDQRDFAGQLQACVESDVRARWMQALRKECFSDLRLFSPLKPFENEYFLPTLTPAEAKEVITAPAARRQTIYEAGLIEQILADLSPGGEGLSPAQVQLVCYTLFEEVQAEADPHLISHSLYQKPRGRGQAGAQGILIGHLGRVLEQKMSAPQRQVARRVLEALVTSHKRRVVKSRPNLRGELKPDQAEVLPQVLDTLVDNRLLRAGRDDADEPNYELAHDYLLAEIELDPETQTRKAAQELLAKEVEDYRRYQTLLAEDKFNIIHSQREFLVLDETANELLRLSQAEIEREARERKKRTQQTITGLAVGLVFITIAAIFGFVGQNRAISAQKTAEAERSRAECQASLTLAQFWQAQGQRVFETDPLLGLRLAIEGWALTPADDIPTRESIARSIRELARQGRLWTLGQEDVESVYATRGNPSVFILDRTNAPGELRRTIDNAVITTLSGPVNEVEFSPNPAAGIFWVHYSDDTPTELRRFSDGQLIVTLPGPVYDLAFSPDKTSRYFTARYREFGPLELRRTADGLVVPLAGAVDEIFFSPDQAASYFQVNYTEGHWVELRRSADAARVPLCDEINWVHFSPDAAGYFWPNCVEYGLSEVHRTADGVKVPLTGPVDNLTFSPDKAARYFVVGYEDGTPGELRRTADNSIITPLSGPVYQVIFSPGEAGGYFVASYYGTRAELRRTTDGQMMAKLDGPVQPHGVTFSPDDAKRYLVVHYSNGHFELWQTRPETTRLVNLDLWGEVRHFDVTHNRLVVSYVDGPAYLLDLAWLSKTGGRAQEMLIEELVKLACEGPFADKQIWTEALETKLREYLGSQESQACPSAR